MHPTKKAAHIAGAIYLSMVVTAPFFLLYLPRKLIVKGDAAATAQNILNHQALFDWAIFGDLVMPVIFICIGIALHRLLSNVNRTWALLMVGFVLVSAGVAFVNTLNSIAAGMLFRGTEYLGALDKPQRDALGMFFLRLHDKGTFINELFWGLWLFPFGLLVYRSGFLPRLLGVWLIVNCFAYLILSPIALFTPTYYGIAFRVATPFMFGEIAIVLWLLIKGAKISPGTVAIPNEV